MCPFDVCDLQAVNVQVQIWIMPTSTHACIVCTVQINKQMNMHMHEDACGKKNKAVHHNIGSFFFTFY